jgi:hypothetical protein
MTEVHHHTKLYLAFLKDSGLVVVLGRKNDLLKECVASYLCPYCAQGLSEGRMGSYVHRGKEI